MARSKAFVLALCVSMALLMSGCEKATEQIDNVYLNFHRAVGYTMSARELVRDLEESGAIKTETAYQWHKRLKQGAKYAEEAYVLFKSGVNASQSQVFFTAKMKADIEVKFDSAKSQIEGLSSVGMPGDVSMRMDGLLSPMQGAIESLAQSVREMPVTRKAVRLSADDMAPVTIKMAALDAQFAEVLR